MTAPVAKSATYLKTVLGFIALLATNVSANLMQGESPWPTNGGEWVRWLVTVIGGTFAVYQVPK